MRNIIVLLLCNDTRPVTYRRWSVLETAEITPDEPGLLPEEGVREWSEDKQEPRSPRVQYMNSAAR